jgi:predicted TIM-barrel fold metal-dependent hydrolase
MARNGFKIFDADTHSGAPADILMRYLTQAEKEKLKPYEPYKVTHRRTGHINYNFGSRHYKRRLGSAKPDEKREARIYMVRKGGNPNPLLDDDPAERIKDMDLEGVDVNLMLPGSLGTFTISEDVELETAIYRAYHRWMADYCGAFPQRLKGVILVGCRDLQASLTELEHCANEDWPLAVYVFAPTEFPLDHPDLEPVWAACEHHNLAVALHTFSITPPYSPGGLDTWQNEFLQRSAAHPWCGQRNMAGLIGSGVMDRYPRLRVGVLEAGHSWLPFWMARIDEQARGKPAALPPLKMKPSDYVLSGRYFQTIEMSEGEKLTKVTLDLLGEDILMYASDYPHSESWFPNSVETVMGWDLPERVKRKLFWENAVRYYARYPSN